jgi:hypothetical protein
MSFIIIKTVVLLTLATGIQYTRYCYGMSCIDKNQGEYQYLFNAMSFI